MKQIKSNSYYTQDMLNLDSRLAPKTVKYAEIRPDQELLTKEILDKSKVTDDFSK